MLDLMRKHARSWLIKFMLFGVIIVFVFWYGWPHQSEKSENYVAKVDDTIISSEEFRQAYESELDRLRARFKGALPPEMLEKLNLKKNMAQRLVNQVLLTKEAQKLGLYVTDQDLITDIKTNPAFQQNGAFSDALYRFNLSAIKMTPTGYERARKKELLESQVVRLITDSVKSDPEEIKRFWHFQNDKLELSMLLVKPAELKEPATADPKDLETFFKEHQSKYEIPASVNIQYVFFSWHDAQKDTQPADEEIKQYYWNHQKEFTEPERIKARHILSKVAKDATPEQKEQIRNKLIEIGNRAKAGEDFAKLAKEFSQDENTAENGGELGFFSKGTMAPQIEKAASELEPGKVSDPVFSDQGYHLILVEEKKPEAVFDLELVKDKIRNKLSEEKARKKIVETADDFYEQVYRSEELESAAKKFGFELHKAETIRKAGSIPGVGTDSNVINEAFQLKTGEISKLVRVGDSYVVLKLLERNKERIPALDEVLSTVEKDYLQQQAQMVAEKKAAEIIEALKQSSDPQETAKRFGLTWENLQPVSRTAGFVEKLGGGNAVNEMLSTISGASPLFPNPVTVPEGVAVVRLSNIQSASEEQFAKEAPLFEKWILEVRATEIMKGWLKIFEDQSKVIINEKLL